MVVKIEQERDVFLSQAKEAHQSKMDLYDKELESLETQASIDFENEKKQLVSKLISNVEEKRRKIKEERESLDITSDHLLDSTRGPGKRNLRNRGLDTVLNSSNKANVRRKQTQNQGITNLTEEEIIADLTEIRKFTGVTGPLSLPNGTKKGTKSGRR
ncbi:hypothetical protein AX774_g1197 [Zancudomyces culisetae]|nr:hypothetical protein AX774_g1197 [Zancudomyces culisetae]|eukprot:OMH85272.1 hypothetical protein AX774_g1197 [Zancudomyces culisetae]